MCYPDNSGWRFLHFSNICACLLRHWLNFEHYLEVHGGKWIIPDLMYSHFFFYSLDPSCSSLVSCVSSRWLLLIVSCRCLFHVFVLLYWLTHYIYHSFRVSFSTHSLSHEQKHIKNNSLKYINTYLHCTLINEIKLSDVSPLWSNKNLDVLIGLIWKLKHFAINDA